jgi:hypothetical protein
MAGWAWRREAGLGRRAGYGLVLGAIAGLLGWSGWWGAPASPYAGISRIDVGVTVGLLAVVPWLIARRYGPGASTALARSIRVAGCAAVVALMLLKTHVERYEYGQVSQLSGREAAGVWAGEAIFLLIIAAYLAGVFAVTARRAPARPAALGTGTLAGALGGLILYALPPKGSSMNLPSGWLASGYEIARVLAVPLVVAAAVLAGMKAARRSGRPSRRRSRIDIPARQGLIAGACTGVAAAMIVSILGMATIALVPQDARNLEWTLPGQHLQPGTLYAFEVSVSQAAVGFLLVLLIFPLIGAGLGAWGGLYGEQRRNPPGGGGGGRGPRGKDPIIPPPPGGKKLDPKPDIGRLLSLPEWDPRARPVGDPLPQREERSPARLS